MYFEYLSTSTSVLTPQGDNIFQDASDYQLDVLQVTTHSIKPATHKVIMGSDFVCEMNHYKISILLCFFLWIPPSAHLNLV